MAQLQPYMHIIVMVLTGLVAGWLAGLLLGGGGLLRNIVVGIIGSFVGGFLVQQGLLKIPFDFNAFIPVYGNQIAVSTIGALLVIIIARILGR
ncbi:MAG: GlsB/YeaQ/YmgE family stress response membrane protein [Hyphomicrobiaceae bacterium]